MSLANQLSLQQINMMRVFIYVKVADMIYRMDFKEPAVPLNVRKWSREVRNHIIIYGENLVSWFMLNMDLNPDEALFLANLLCSHLKLFDLTNNFMTEMNLGTFFRYQYGINELSDDIDDYEYASYLCKREEGIQSRGDVDNYKIDFKEAYKIDFSKWKFEFVQSEKATSLASIIT